MSLYIYSRDARRGLVRQLARRLGIRCVDANLRPRPRDVRLICWGVSTNPTWNLGQRWILNTPAAVSIMAHKIRTFEALDRAGVACLVWTASQQEAREWLREDGSVYIRNTLQGHSGEGLVYHQTADGALPNAPLYTRNYGTPFKEYRIHVVNGRIIDITMKRRMNEETLRERDLPVPEERERLQVRTYGNGWVFTRQNTDQYINNTIRTLAITAVQAVGGQMGAVDIVAKWSREGRFQNARVVEINSAPALRSTTTLNAYVEALRPLVNA